MIEEVSKRYESFHDAVISKYSYERSLEDMGRVEIYIRVMNALDDYIFEEVKLTFIDIFKIRFVEEEKMSSLIINSALLKEEGGIVTMDFFPDIYSWGLKENPDSDFYIKCRKIEYEVL